MTSAAPPPFQPTLPARGATGQFCPQSICQLFQPTLPARGATPAAKLSSSAATFQPTLPARGATIDAETMQTVRTNFNPRSPHGERLARA